MSSAIGAAGVGMSPATRALARLPDRSCWVAWSSTEASCAAGSAWSSPGVSLGASAVSAAAGIVDAVAASGDRVRVATTSGRDSGMVDAARGEHELLEDLALVLQDRQGALELPAADRRRPVALLVLTGEPDPALVAAVDAAGFTDRRLISFSGHPSCPGADVVVGPGEPVAVAWGRAVDEAER